MVDQAIVEALDGNEAQRIAGRRVALAAIVMVAAVAGVIGWGAAAQQGGAQGVFRADVATASLQGRGGPVPDFSSADAAGAGLGSGGGSS